MPWYTRLLNVFRDERLNEELDLEFRYHLAETADRLSDGGMPEAEAAREAERRLGAYLTQKERTRDMNVAAWLDTLRADVIYGLRQLRSNPGFTSVAILSLALGIGANTAIFQLIDALRFRMLPVRNPSELVSVDFAKGSVRAGWWPSRSAVMTYAEWERIGLQQRAFTGVLAWSANRFNLAGAGEPRFAEGLYVSGNFFHELGVGAMLGRTLSATDDSPACPALAVLSHAFWQREFAGDPAVLARTVHLDGHSFSIIGVTPPGFFGLEVGSRYDVAVPLCADRLLAEDHIGKIPNRAAWWLSAMGRLKPGWTVRTADAHLRALSTEIMRATLPPDYMPGLAKGYLANLLVATDAGTGVSGLRQQYERPLWLLLAITGLVLLIACANLANLLLARAAVREPELAVRLALGASRTRLLGQLLAESLLLALAGAALGWALALTLSRALIAFISTRNDPVFLDQAMDWRVPGFTIALAVSTCLLFGLVPALRATCLAPVAAMRSGGRNATAGRERASLRRALVSAQVALSLVLLFGALLFVRSLHNLLTVDAGFQPEGVLAVKVDFNTAGYPKERRLPVDRALSDSLSRLPGVLSVAQVAFTPLSGGTWDNLVAADGANAAATGKQSYFNLVSPGYFRTMGTPLLAGRDFNDRDTPASPKVAIVNEAFARKFFGGANPVGRTFRMAAGTGNPEPLFSIVGIVKNSKYAALREDFRPIAFFPCAQDRDPPARATFVLRMQGPPARLIDNAKKAVSGLGVPFGIEFQPLSEQLRDSLLRERLMATLSGGFALLAAILCALGLYGVIAYMVARRRAEVGVRIALGADRADIIRLVLREAVALLGAGLVTGIAIALIAGKTASSLLFGLPARDAASLLAATALLTLIALIAGYLPARRAASLDPAITLRDQ